MLLGNCFRVFARMTFLAALGKARQNLKKMKGSTRNFHRTSRWASQFGRTLRIQLPVGSTDGRDRT